MYQNTLNPNNFVIINIWTSQSNQDIPGANVGHVSLETKDYYASLWPGKLVRKPRPLNSLEKFYLNYFGERPPSFKASYEEDSALEAIAEDRERKILHINQCTAEETPYSFNYETGEVKALQAQPRQEDMINCDMFAIRVLHANVRIVIYGLNIADLQKAFLREQKGNTTSWRMVGSNLLSRIGTESSAENCSSLSYKLLIAGGMFLKVKDHSSSETSLVVTPDDLIKYVIEYKRKELKNNIETQAWFRQKCPQETNIDELEKSIADRKQKRKEDEQSKRSALTDFLKP